MSAGATFIDVLTVRVRVKDIARGTIAKSVTRSILKKILSYVMKRPQQLISEK
jgi:hypothetical protein